MTEDELLKKTVTWFAAAYAEIAQAGGHPSLVLSKFPNEAILLMIKNNLFFKYERYIND